MLLLFHMEMYNSLHFIFNWVLHRFFEHGVVQQLPLPCMDVYRYRVKLIVVIFDQRVHIFDMLSIYMYRLCDLII